LIILAASDVLRPLQPGRVVVFYIIPHLNSTFDPKYIHPPTHPDK
jgi:hypothetical protein